MNNSLLPPEFGETGPLPRGRHKLERNVVLASQRGRLLSAFVQLAAERGYDAVTIIDIVSLAGTSKRTFYEHFEDKEDCLLQAFDTMRNLLVSAVLTEAGPIDHPIDRIRVGVRAYIDALSGVPDFAKLFLSEAMAAGPALAERWTESTDLMAATIHTWRDRSRRDYPEVPPLSIMRAKIVLLGLNTVVLEIVHRDGIDALGGRTDELVDEAIALLTAP